MVHRVERSLPAEETHITRLLLPFSGCSKAAATPWLAAESSNYPELSQRLLRSHYSRLLLIRCLWSGSCCVLSCSSNKPLPAPSAPSPGAPMVAREPQPAGGIKGVWGPRGQGSVVPRWDRKHGNSRKLAESKSNGGQRHSFFFFKGVGLSRMVGGHLSDCLVNRGRWCVHL